MHLKNIFKSGELNENSVTEDFSVTATDGKKYKTKAFAESEFEKYRIIQDKLFESDFDKPVKRIDKQKTRGE